MTGGGPDPSWSRRRLLLAGAGGSALLLGACSGGGGGPATHGRTRPLSPGDLPRIAVGAAVDNLAVAMYQSMLARAATGQYGTLPPAVHALWETARAHHADHARRANLLLEGAHAAAVNVPDPALAPTVMSLVASSRGLPSLTDVAMLVEETAAATHQANAADLTGTGAVAFAASVSAVEAQHVAVWNLLNGRYPGSLNEAGTAVAFTSPERNRPASDLRPTGK